MAGKKIAIVLPDLRGGGAERLHINLANDWVSRGYSVEMVLMQKRGELVHLVSPKIDIYELDVCRIRQVIRQLRKYFKLSKPDIILSAMWPLTSATVVAWVLASRQGRLFLSDHVQLSVSCEKELDLPLSFLKILMRVTYPLATGVIAVSKGVKADMCRLGALSETQVQVIYNPAATGESPSRGSPQLQEQLWGEGCQYHILSVGALKAQKDHENLLRAFALLPPDIDAKLIILGEGVLRSNLENVIEELGMKSRISLPGFVRDPYPWFRTADLFVLASQWEGFANVIVEALQCGVPVVSTDCTSGPNEILENGKYGKLVPIGSPKALAEAIAASLREPYDRKQLIRRAAAFSVSTISSQYLSYMQLGENQNVFEPNP